MSLKELLHSDLKGAMKARDSLRLNTIRGLNTEIKNQEIQLGQKDLDDEAVMSIVSTQIKKRKEAIEHFEKGQRKELADQERQEMEVLLKYLPEQVSEDVLRQRVQEVVEELDAKSPSDLGKVMKVLVPEFKGKADNKLIKDLVGERLNS